MTVSEKVGAKSDAQRGQTLVRGLDIIHAVETGAGTIHDVAAATGLTYSTVHRLISVLIEQNYLRSIDGRGLSLGRRLIELGFAAYAGIDLVQEAHPLLVALSQATRDTVHLAQRDGVEVFYLDKLPGARAVQISSRVGGRKPLVTTGVGKAMLLDDTTAQWQALYHAEGYRLSGMSENDWLRMMSDYRQRGIAYDTGEDESIIRCVAAPLRDASGRIIAAISVSSTTEHMPADRMAALIPTVLGVAADISAIMGYRTKTSSP